MRYMSIFETAKKWSLSPRQVDRLCVEDRINGTQKAGNNWNIPEDAEKPDGRRIKSGRYIHTNAAND